MLAACSIGWFWMVIAQPYLGFANGINITPGEALSWCAVATIAGFGGSAEDVWHFLRARWRLIFTFLSAICGVVLLDLRVPALGLHALDAAWVATPWLR